MADDVDLLTALEVALAPAASEPSSRELAALRSVVAEVAANTARSRSTRWQRRVAALIAGTVVLSGGTAYATSSSAPRPVRSAAFALKLPVEAPDVTDAKRALADLERALAEGRRDHVVAALADLERELAELTPGERAAIEPQASLVLEAARSFLATGPDDDHERSGEGRGGSDDDGGGTSGTSGSESGSESDDRSGTDGSGSVGSGSGGSGRDGSDDVHAGDSTTSGSGTSGGGSDTSGSGSDDGTRSGSGSSGDSGDSGTSGSGETGSRSGSGSRDGSGTSGGTSGDDSSVSGSGSGSD